MWNCATSQHRRCCPRPCRLRRRVLQGSLSALANNWKRPMCFVAACGFEGACVGGGRRVWCVRGWRAACVYGDRGLAAPKHPHAGTIRWPWCGRDFAPGPLWQDLAQALVAGCCHWHCAFMVFVFVALCVSGYASEMLSARFAISGHPAPLEHLLAGRQHRIGGATRGHPYISLLRVEARNCQNRVHHSHVPAGLMASRMSHSG